MVSANRLVQQDADSSLNFLRRLSQTALRTREVADNTLVELQRQGQRLNVINNDLNEIDADIKEAKGILAYMRRCCLCFLCACWCDCDPSKEADRTRDERVQMRKDMRAREVEMHANAQPKGYQGRQDEEVARQAQQQRSELLGADAAGSAEAPRRRGWQVGEHLDAKDRDELAVETDKQDHYLDIVGGALSDLTRAARDMNEELEMQDKQLADLQDHAGTTLDNLNEVESSTRRDFKLRETADAKRQARRSKMTPSIGKLTGLAAKGAAGGSGGGSTKE